jgi:hypothetical protein
VIGVAQGERLEVRRRLIGSGIAYWHHGIDMGDDTVVLSLPQSERDLLVRKVLLSHPQNPPFLVMPRFKTRTSWMDQETGRTSVERMVDGMTSD